MTAKEKGLWAPLGDVSSEDIIHMKNRLSLHRAVDGPQGLLRSTEPCAPRMCTWIRAKAEAYDAKVLVRSVAPAGPDTAVAPASSATAEINLLGNHFRKAAVPAPLASRLEQDVRALGAIDARELQEADWRGLPSWSSLKPLEQRRLLRCAGYAP